MVSQITIYKSNIRETRESKVMEIKGEDFSGLGLK